MNAVSRSGAIVAALALVPSAHAGQQRSLPDLFRTQVELAGPQLKLRGQALDSDVALAMAASGVSWRPSVAGVRLFSGEGKKLSYTGPEGRMLGLRRAVAAGDERTAFCFAFSLAVQPGNGETDDWRSAYEHVSRYGEGLDRVLVGVLGADERIPLLAGLQYSAADLLVWRTDAAHIPVYLAMAQSKDSYVRSRGIAALGLASYTTIPGKPPSLAGLLVAPREMAVSATQRAIFHDIIERAASDASYRVRAASAMALGLAGSDGALERLQRMAKDRAYVSFAGRSRQARQIVYPVRSTAAAALTRLGLRAIATGGELSGRDLRDATRGGRDVTRDTRGMRRDRSSTVRFHRWEW